MQGWGCALEAPAGLTARVSLSKNSDSKMAQRPYRRRQMPLAFGLRGLPIMRSYLFAAALIASTLSMPALAEEGAPAPAAGPTRAAAEGFCGEATASAKDLIERYSKDAKLKQVYKSDEYLAFADNDKDPTVMYTLTTDVQAAHPAAICRKIVKDGEQAVIKMNIVCDGPADQCKKLTNEFNVMTAQMQAAVDAKIKEGAK